MVQVRRVSSNSASWGINLAFDCHYIRDFRPSSSCMTVTVGNSRAAQVGSKDRWGRAWSKNFDVPNEYVCPAEITKDNWVTGDLGTGRIDGAHDNSNKIFRVMQRHNGKIKVRRSNPNGRQTTAAETTWAESLTFECCRPQTQCRSVTIGDSGHARRDADGWTTPVAIHDSLACPTELRKGDWLNEQAMVKHDGHLTAGDKFTVRQANGEVSVHRVNGRGAHITNGWGMWLAFECCESTVTTHVVENKCHPSNCADWTCDDWCKCFEQDVESEQHYDQEKCGDDGSVCSCCTGVNGAYDCAKGDYFGVL